MPVNTVTIVGNLTRDPELKALPTGTQVCDLGVAVNERIKQGQEWVDRASFFDVTVFGSQAEACAKFLVKGRQVAVAGRLRQERWTDQQGQNRSRVKIVASEVQFVGGKPEAVSGHEYRQRAQEGAGYSRNDPPQPSMGDFGAPPVVQQGPHTSPDDEIPF